MSVLVKDMHFPKYCSGCEFSKPWGNNGTYCSRHPEKDDVKYGEGKPDWCPLEDVPTPHGDLIDAFAFRREMDANYPFDKFTQSKHGEADAAKSAILMMLAKAPTIIEAEGET